MYSGTGFCDRGSSISWDRLEAGFLQDGVEV